MKHRAGVTLPPRTTHTELHTGKRNLKTQDVKLNVRNKKDRNTEQESQNTEHRIHFLFAQDTAWAHRKEESLLAKQKTKHKVRHMEHRKCSPYTPVCQISLSQRGKKKLIKMIQQRKCKTQRNMYGCFVVFLNMCLSWPQTSFKAKITMANLDC